MNKPYKELKIRVKLMGLGVVLKGTHIFNWQDMGIRVHGMVDFLVNHCGYKKRYDLVKETR